MIAVDTNVIVRIIVGDNEAQARSALTLAARETFYVSFTVLEETEWVLRSRYAYHRGEIVRAFAALDDLVAMIFEHDDDARWAMARYARGGELADYLHVASARAVGRFATFERKLARRAGAGAPALVETLV